MTRGAEMTRTRPSASAAFSATSRVNAPRTSLSENERTGLPTSPKLNGPPTTSTWFGKISPVPVPSDGSRWVRKPQLTPYCCRNDLVVSTMRASMRTCRFGTSTELMSSRITLMYTGISLMISWLVRASTMMRARGEAISRRWLATSAARAYDSLKATVCVGTLSRSSSASRRVAFASSARRASVPTRMTLPSRM